MKKRTYRSIPVKQVDRGKLAEQVCGGRVVVGVDVAKEEHFATVTVDGMESLVRFSWSSREETREVVDLVRSLGSGAEVALEPSGTYGDALRWQLEAAQIPVFRVAPKRVHDMAEVYDGVPSMHDRKAPSVVAKLHWDRMSERWSIPTDRERVLRAVVQGRMLHAEQIQRSVGRLEALLARHWPELPSILKLDSATLLELLRQMGGSEQVASQPEAAAVLMRRVGGWLLKQEKIDAVVGSAGSTLGLPMLAAELELVQALATEIRAHQRELRRVERLLRQMVADDPEMAALAAVVGPVTAAQVTALVGRASSYANAKSFLKALGLNLKERSSGKFKGELKITKRGPARARQVLYLACLRLINRDPVVRAWYEAKVARQGGQLKKKAVVAVLRKVVKALWWIAKDRTRFDAYRLFDTRRLNLPPRARETQEQTGSDDSKGGTASR